MSGITIEKPSGVIPLPLDINVSAINAIGTYDTNVYPMEIMAVRTFFSFNMEGAPSGPIVPPIIIPLSTYKIQLGWNSWNVLSVSLINTSTDIGLQVAWRYTILFDDADNPDVATIQFYLEAGIDYDAANFIFFANFQKTS
jgi:hypothetical protein